MPNHERVSTLLSSRDVVSTAASGSVIKNIAHLCGRNKSKMWGPEGWKKVVVCVVSDGRNKINKRTLQVLTLVSRKYQQTGVMLICFRWAVTKRVLPKIP